LIFLWLKTTGCLQSSGYICFPYIFHVFGSEENVLLIE
jgi:hypothetical protein